MNFTKNNIVKLVDGREVKIINLPTTFMSNGSYEVIYQGKQIWVKPEEILYQIDTNWVDDINHYFEIIFDENGINIIPKELSSINVESDREDINRIKFNFLGNRKHSVINFHVGDTIINDESSITKRPTKKRKSKIEKVINIIKGEEDEI